MQTRLDIILETVSQILEGKKPDFLDFDKDGNRKEPMTDAIKDAKKKKGFPKGGYPTKDPHGGVRRVRAGHGDLEQG